ncbi:hypothetical protein BGW36DRAFT_424574 [Talaromyces proteolyticus]|uniref:Uncharacterized protein n=1 Tax=Talaromyces proteolyticus TaxID=1131652 RepID=A0AAD4KXF7_9EURO|nr:uncharacterized protein BGW36DRAFT_424574 [Talaromyces proteolyticus]KAH8702294.1 hypothetical protein BGW36DRAFT_424574 [Talaromyces proteolyticus]
MSDQKYYIYSSDAGQSGGTNKLILKKDLPIDDFVSRLKNKVIILQETPEADEYTPCDASDEWVKWVGNFGENGQVSAMVDPELEPDEALQSFQFNVAGPGGQALVFESSAEALESAFGSEAAGLVDPPGALVTSSVLLYSGLIEPSSNLTAKVEDLFNYVGQEELLENLPSSLTALTATISSSTYEGRRNALWFNPELDSQTILRLQYQLDAKNAFEGLLQNQVPGLEFIEFAAICRKIMTEGQTADDELVGVDQGTVSLQATCTVSNTKMAAPLQMTMGIDFSESGMTFILKPSQQSDGNLDDVLKWLEGVVASNLPVRDFFGPGDTFQGLSLQQVVLSFNTTTDPASPRLASIRVDIEAAGNFGKVDDKMPVFLMTYSWMRAIGGVGSVRGQLWSSYDISKERILQPYYEVWTDISPATRSPGTAINLATLIPGQTVSIPENIPSQITNAYAELSAESVSFGALVATREPQDAEGQVPQPYLQQLRLDVSYAWQRVAEFKFNFKVLAGIPPPAGISPSPGITYDQDTIISGELSYFQGGERHEQ